MPTLRYYDGTQYQPLPGMPGPTGPSGPAGPAGPGWTGLTEYWRSQSAVAAAGPNNATGTFAQDTTIPNLTITARAGVWYRVIVAARCQVDTAATTMDIGVLDGGASAPTAASTVVASASEYVAVAGGPGGTQIVLHQDVQFTAGVHTLGVFSRRTAGPTTANVALSGSASQTKDLTVFNPSFSGPSGVTGATGPTGPAGLSGTIVSLRAYRASAYAAPTTAAILTWDTKQWDTQNAYNTSTGLFTAPVAGKYKIDSQIGANIAASGGYLTLAIYKNGVAYGARSFSQYTSAASQWAFAQVIDTVDLVVGDTISLYASALASTTLNPGNDLTYFAIDLISSAGPQGVTGPTGPTGPSYAGGQLYNLVYYQTIPAPQVVSNPFTIAHNLNTSYLLTQAWDSVTQQEVLVQWQAVDNNHVAISVSANCPNALNVVVMGTGASLAPINPGDVATKAYVDAKTATLPAPVTSGSTTQSFTDVLGDVWVAKAGVNGGNWRRARDVVHAEYYRAAALTAPTAWTAFIYDTAAADAYGIVSGGVFTPPVPGLYELVMYLTFNPTATGQHCDLSFYNNTTAQYIAQGNNQSAQASWGVYVMVPHKRLFVASDVIATRILCAAALAVQVGNFSSGGLLINYLGTG